MDVESGASVDVGAGDHNLRLPAGVTVDALREAVAASRSWRGVLRHFGMSAPRNGRSMRAACDALGISYEHFNGTRWDRLDEAALVRAVATSRSWIEVMARLGFAVDSGSARASLRRSALALGLDVSHLAVQPVADAGDPFSGVGDERQLRHAASLLVAAKCTMLGHRVAWPLEPQPYDLLVDTAQKGILRVQVKSGTQFVGGSWVASITKVRRGPTGARQRTAYTAEEVDYFAIVDAERQVYMLPIGLVEGQTAVSLRKYDAYRMAC
jgi:hypothetical protein